MNEEKPKKTGGIEYFYLSNNGMVLSSLGWRLDLIAVTILLISIIHKR